MPADLQVILVQTNSDLITDATTGGVSLITVSGGSTGDVLVKQADGTYLPETLSVGSGDLLSTNNLSDLASAGTARSNLGLGGLAVLSEVTDTELSSATLASAVQPGDLATVATSGDYSDLTGTPVRVGHAIHSDSTVEIDDIETWLDGAPSGLLIALGCGIYGSAVYAYGGGSLTRTAVTADRGIYEWDGTGLVLLDPQPYGEILLSYVVDVTDLESPGDWEDYSTTAVYSDDDPPRIDADFPGLDVLGAASKTAPYHASVALSGNAAAITAGTKKGTFVVPIAGTITAFRVDCDPANEPSASSVEVDLNKIDRTTGVATTVLSAVATIATSANVSTGGTIDGTQTVSVGDMLTLDIDQGSDGKELLATITITPN